MESTSILTVILTQLFTFITAVAASSGFWLAIQNRRDKKDQSRLLLLGLAHDRIVYLGLKYIERGWISQEEYENLHDYLYTPYKNMGGNGSANRVMCEVDKLPIQKMNREREMKEC